MKMRGVKSKIVMVRRFGQDIFHKFEGIVPSRARIQFVPVCIGDLRGLAESNLTGIVDRLHKVCCRTVKGIVQHKLFTFVIRCELLHEFPKDIAVVLTGPDERRHTRADDIIAQAHKIVVRCGQTVVANMVTSPIQPAPNTTARWPKCAPP